MKDVRWHPRVQTALRRDPLGWAEEGLRRRSPHKSLRSCTEIERLMALLDQADAPVELIVLEDACQALKQACSPNLRTVSLSHADQAEDERCDLTTLDTGIDLEADVIAAEAQRQAQKEFLSEIWTRAAQLPSNQRSALLLGLERSIFHSLVVHDIATFVEIKQTLGTTRSTFAEIWKRLPLDDQAIATELRLSCAQVNDRRQSAYRTLARHLRPYNRSALRRLWQSLLCLEPPQLSVYLLWARDIHGSSLLALLAREDIVRRTEIPDRLHVSASSLDGVMNRLPLSFEQIAHLLAKTPREVARLSMEAHSMLKHQFANDDSGREMMAAIICTSRQQE